MEHQEVLNLRGELSRVSNALLRSQTGRGAGDWLLAVPTSPLLTLEPVLFLVALRRRLLFPLPAGPRHCLGCHQVLDVWGHHLLACPRTGWLKRRSKGFEMAWVQVCLEAGAAASHRPLLRNLAVPGVPDTDNRQLHLVAGGLPLYGARTLVGDATLRSPVAADGTVRFGADRKNGATFPQARQDKGRTYPEFEAHTDRIEFKTLAAEIGGRFSEECLDLVRRLVEHRSRQAPPALRGSFYVIFSRRWWGILSMAVQRAVAANLVGADWPLIGMAPQPDLEELMTCVDITEPSRLC